MNLGAKTRATTTRRRGRGDAVNKIQRPECGRSIVVGVIGVGDEVNRGGRAVGERGGGLRGAAAAVDADEGAGAVVGAFERLSELVDELRRATGGELDVVEHAERLRGLAMGIGFAERGVMDLENVERALAERRRDANETAGVGRQGGQSHVVVPREFHLLE